MKIPSNKFSILLMSVFSFLSTESVGQKNNENLVSRFLYAPNPLPYSEALKTSELWGSGLPKKQIKTIKAGLNDLRRPKGLSSPQEMAANQFNISRLFLYWVREFRFNDINYYLICIPKKENSAMPIELRPTKDLYMCVSDQCVSKWRAYDPALDGAISRYYSPNEFYPGKYESCRIMNPDGILPSKLIYEHQGWLEFINPDLKEDVVLYSKEIDRPDFLLSSAENRSTYAARFPFYTCNAIAEFYIDGKKTCLVEINAFENRHMPKEMIPLQSMYLLVKDSALDRSRGWDAELDGNPEPINSETSSEYSEDEYPRDFSGLDIVIEKGKEVQCYITDRGELYSEAGIEEFRDQLSSWFPNFDEVAEGIVQNAWPKGINSLEKREENDLYFIEYNAYAVARIEAADRTFYIVKVNPEQNRHMPAGMIPDKTIYFLFGPEGLSLEKIKFTPPEITPATDNEEELVDLPVTIDNSEPPKKDIDWKIAVAPGEKKRVYIVDRGQLYSTLELAQYKMEIESYIGKKYDQALKFGTEANWPEGISTLQNRDIRTNEFVKYSVNAIAKFSLSFYLLEVLPEENLHMPADMRSDKPFYMVIDSDGISAEKP